MWTRVTFIFLVGCGPSAQQVCDDYATAWCDRHYACFQGTSLTTLQSAYGQTAADCAVSYAATQNCMEAQGPCATGTAYDTGAAETCATDYANASITSCDDIAQATFTPPSCTESLICH